MAEDTGALVDGLRRSFDDRRTYSFDWRTQQLRRLTELCTEEEARMLEALRADLGKPEFEGYAAEVSSAMSEARYALRNLKKWMRPEKVPTPVASFLGKSRVHRAPLGVVLIIGPWNYPIQLLLSPLVGAIAAGNCALMKPSELTPHTTTLIAELVPRYLDQECVRVVEGGVPETTELLAERFDHIFFTGSTAVGKIVYQAAARHLTPVTLELGGKSPCIVDRDVDVALAARRIAWGKFFNAGQTCVAPDYVLVDRTREEELLAALAQTIEQLYGNDPHESPDFGRIVNAQHHERLVRLLDGCEVRVGGQSVAAERYLAPTVLTKVPADAPVMTEEIFGPVLPVLPVDSVEEAITFVHDRPKPLALYVFTRQNGTADRVLAETTSGGACINDSLSHVASHSLPFGGVGDSGIGAYHGKASFETFSQRRSVYSRSNLIDIPLRYPPYGRAVKLVRKLLG